MWYAMCFVLHFQAFWDIECLKVLVEVDTKKNILSIAKSEFVLHIFYCSYLLNIFVGS